MCHTVPCVVLHDNHQLRITLWPGVPLPVPPYSRGVEYTLHSSGAFLLDSNLNETVEDRDGEIYLRLAHLDLDDPVAILDFARHHGVFDGAAVRDALSSLSPSAERAPLTARWAEQVAPFDARAFAEQDTELQKFAAQLRDPWAARAVPLDSFRFAVRCIRDLLTAWRVVSDDPELDRTNASWELLNGQPGPPTKIDAYHVMTRLLPLLLPRFGTFSEGGADPDPDPDDEGQEMDSAWFEARTSVSIEQASGFAARKLHEICALELYNHIAGGEFPRTCQNETCGRPFVRQYGRSQHGQSRREGVMYCTSSCAQSQAQRQYRRRQKAKRLTA